MKNKKPHILLTNDDGIHSPGLWAAAEALAELGYVDVVAPREQSSGAGRSLPSYSDGIIHPQTMNVRGKEWQVYAVGGTPAQAVLHGVLEVVAERPKLVVSGINFGENLGSGVTISGTVGAALEAASLGIPALAVSLETPKRYHLSHSTEVDFSIAAYFCRYFARLVLRGQLPEDVDVLKVDVPSNADENTPWVVSRLSRKRYYETVPPSRVSWAEPGRVDYRYRDDLLSFPPDSDVYVVRVRRMVSVTPLSLDLTSRVNLQDLEALLRGKSENAGAGQT